MNLLHIHLPLIGERERGFRVTGFPGEKLIVPYLDLAVMILYRAGRSVPPCPASSKEQKDANKGVLGATGTAKPLRVFFLYCAAPIPMMCSPARRAALAYKPCSLFQGNRQCQCRHRAASLQTGGLLIAHVGGEGGEWSQP